MTARVGVCVPTWRGGDFIGETLASLLAQTHANFRVFISIDGDDHGTAAACQTFVADARVTVVAQAERLNWVRNTNAAIGLAARAGAEWICVQPHDDIVAPNYLQALADAAQARPDGAVFYSDIECFGARGGVLIQPDIVGGAVDRQTVLLRRHFSAIAYRGLMRVETALSAPLIENTFDNFGCDTAWMARLACAGALLRVPEPLYRKRYHARNTHTAWGKMAPAAMGEAWFHHCLDMAEAALSVCASDDDVTRVMSAAITRAVGAVVFPFQNLPRPSGADEQAALVRRFEEACVARFNLQRAP